MCDKFITTMARDEDNDGSVSQRSNKSTTSRKKNGFNKKIQGDIEELGNNVYMYGSRNQGDMYIKMMEAIAPLCGERV